MSTAGKVLIVVVMVLTFVWIVLSAGVSRLNTNANTKLYELTKKVEDLQGQVKERQDEIVSVLNQTSQTQEKIDREFMLLRGKQSDLERARSKIFETLAGVKFELEILQGTVKVAETDLGHRNDEFQEETTKLGADRAKVDELMADCAKQRNRLGSLRKEFQTSYHANIEMLGKSGKTTESHSGSAN
jgi:predicted  nucleic acid-binding Zn-ribbon protein